MTDLFGDTVPDEAPARTMGLMQRRKVAIGYHRTTRNDMRRCETCANIRRRGKYVKCILISVGRSDASDLALTGTCDLWEAG